MSKIKSIKARQILDSRGTPTIECEVLLEDGSYGRASIPSGSSTGSYEALELRDNDPKSYFGKSVLQAVKNVNDEIAPTLIGQEAANQRRLDQFMIRMDGTENKSKLGANAILSVSLAIAVAQAQSEKLELFEYLGKFSSYADQPYEMPFAMINVINGGKHAANASDFQEYMIIPNQLTSFRDRLRCGAEIFHELKKILQDKNLSTLVGDEGGFAPTVDSNEEPLSFLTQASESAGYIPGRDVFFGIDAASSEFFEKYEYVLKCENKNLTRVELAKYYENLISKYPIRSLEDPFEQNDFSGWADFNRQFGKKVQIVGDDLYATNAKRLEMGIEMKSSNSILIKLNQIGTLTETIDVINLAHSVGMTTIVSHRSGETEDTFIADLVVAMRSGQIKTGSMSRSERIAKYNRLLRIGEKIIT